MRKAIKYIKSNWKKGQSLKEIANNFDIDEGNLERAFRTVQGVTVKHFFDEKRKKYIENEISKRKVIGYQIGMKLGFKTDKSFYRWVKRVFGISYRELHKKLRQ